MLVAINPATGEIVREVPEESTQSVDSKLSAARDAFGAWSRTDFSTRGALLRRVAGVLREDVEALAARMTEEMGKTQREARSEIEKCARTCEHFAENAATYLSEDVLESDATRSYVQYLPLGAVLGILPWNSPFWLAFRVCAPAVMAGNACLIKHDPHVPGCAQAIADVFRRAGAPEGLLQILLVDDDGTHQVIRDPRVSAVSFTGSTGAGRAVAARAAAEIKPAVLELGGSDPCLVFADADLHEAARIACLSRIIATGQSCIAAKRILVEASVYDEFVSLLQLELEKLVQGDPTREDTDVGPMARVDLRTQLDRQVQESVALGARCRLGGKVPEGPGSFYPITLLTDVTPEMAVFREETFGPVAVVARFEDEAEAIRLANQTDFGLGGSVWCSAERGEAIARQLEVGQVSVNGIVKTDPRLPSGGIKQSGYGKELGPHGIREFVNAQQVWVGPAR